jgi:RNA polymerase sigma-70 factor (ECF subfamily)
MSTLDATDEQLGRRALAGDREAFTELFGRHESGLFNVSYRLTGSREDAADITQEAFLRVFARLDDLAGREVNLAAYLHRTARNLVYDRSAHGARVSPTDEVERVAGADDSADADPELTALIADQGSDVRAANARLPERHRLALALRELEDMSYEDIGRVLDITPGAVAQLLVRARNALRRELRLGQVDAEAMDAGCRARLGDIGALIDGELNADRAHVLTQHMALCASCTEARASFEQARVTYRAWLPLPLIGLGAGTARAAEGRGLVRFSDAARRSTLLRRGAGGGAGGVSGLLAGRRRAGAMVGAGVLGALLLFGAPTLVAVRSGSEPPPRVEAPATTTTTTASAPAPAPPPPAAATTAAPVVANAPAPVPGAVARVASRPPAVVIDPTTSPAPPPVVTVRPRATRRAPAPPAPAPPVSVAGTTVADPPATPPPVPPARVPDPPVTSRTDTVPVPGTPSDNPPRPTDPGPNDPPPGTTRTDPPTTVRTDVPPRGEF